MAISVRQQRLKQKGYNYRLIFSRSSGNCDQRDYEQTLADTLIWIWQGYQPD